MIVGHMNNDIEQKRLFELSTDDSAKAFNVRKISYFCNIVSS